MHGLFFGRNINLFLTTLVYKASVIND